MTAKRDKQGAANREANASPNHASRVVYTPRVDATPEGELAALAACYAIVLKAHEQKAVTAEVVDVDSGTTAVDLAGESGA